MKKIKIRDLTAEQYDDWKGRLCDNLWLGKCASCPFKGTNCSYSESKFSWINNKNLYSDKFLDEEIILDAKTIIKLTNAEKIILKNLSPKYKYIARNQNGDLYIYKDKPYRLFNCWYIDDLQIFDRPLGFRNGNVSVNNIILEEYKPYKKEN